MDYTELMACSMDFNKCPKMLLFRYKIRDGKLYWMLRSAMTAIFGDFAADDKFDATVDAYISGLKSYYVSAILALIEEYRNPYADYMLLNSADTIEMLVNSKVYAEDDLSRDDKVCLFVCFVHVVALIRNSLFVSTRHKCASGDCDASCLKRFSQLDADIQKYTASAERLARETDA